MDFTHNNTVPSQCTYLFFHFPFFTTCFSLNQPSSGVLSCQTVILYWMPLTQFTCTLMFHNFQRYNFYYFLYPFLLYHTLMVSRLLFFSLDVYTIGRTPWTSDQPAARPLPKYRRTQTQNNVRARTHKHTHTHQTSMPEVGFQPTITASAWAKSVHTLDRSATMTG
jgi:hypothetical protein